MVRSFSHAFYGIAALLSFVDAKEPDITWSTPSQQQSLSSTDDDEGVIAVGIVNPRPICDAESGIGCSVGVKILSALEADELLTVTGVEMGELNCEGLEYAENADKLTLTISSNQVVTAKKKSFREIDGAAFSDDASRKVWTGTVKESDDFEGLPRSISMTWSGCNIQTFMVKLITPTSDGSVHTTASVPCDTAEDSIELCVLDIHREGEDETDEEVETEDFELKAADEKNDGNIRRLGSPLIKGSPDASVVEKGDGTTLPSLMRVSKKDAARRHLAEVAAEGIEKARLSDPDIDAKDSDIRLLEEYRSASPHEKEAFHARGVRRLSEDLVSMPSGRVLQDSYTIDVLVIYTRKALFESNRATGAMRTKSQMETDIITAYEGANNALDDSGIGFNIRVVHMEQIKYTEKSISDAVHELYRGEISGVHAMRDKYGADLVQLVGFYSSACGIGFTMQKPSSGFQRYGYSVVHTNCLSNFSHIHEVGHNMGANHDKSNTGSSHSYAYAQRYCDGSKPYRTIMAYETGCRKAPRVNLFSSPDKNYAGQAQGTASANNARVLNEAMSTVANFRKSRQQPKAPMPAPTPRPAPTPKPVPTQPRSSKVKALSIYPEAVPGVRMKARGCYRDDAKNRIMKVGTEMPAISGRTKGMTRSNCMAYCHKKGKSYRNFGVEAGDKCFCGRSNKEYKRLGRINGRECSSACAGDKRKSCGGKNAMEVFRIRNLDYDEDLAPSNYLGCYRDNFFDFRMDSQPVVDYTDMTHEVCRRHCNTAGYDLFSLEFGFVCSCGDDGPDKKLKVKNTSCKLPCSSSKSTLNCGGNWYKAIHSVGISNEDDSEDDGTFDGKKDSGEEESGDEADLGMDEGDSSYSENSSEEGESGENEEEEEGGVEEGGGSSGGTSEEEEEEEEESDYTNTNTNTDSSEEQEGSGDAEGGWKGEEKEEDSFSPGVQKTDGDGGSFPSAQEEHDMHMNMGQP